jgi:hypothetical protein
MDSNSGSLQQAITAQQRDLTGSGQTRDEPGNSEAERLRSEVERLQRELTSARELLREETGRSRRAEDRAQYSEKAHKDSERQLRYQEYKSELLRRELEKKGRARSSNRDSNRHQNIPEVELRRLVGNHEIFRNIYDKQSDDDIEDSMTKKERKKLRRKEREEEEREEKELATLPAIQGATPSRSATLEDRIRDTSRPLSERIQFGSVNTPASQDDVTMLSQDDSNPAPEPSDARPGQPGTPSLQDRIDKGPLIDRLEGRPDRPEALPADQRERWYRRMEGWDPTRRPIGRQRLYREYIPMFDGHGRRIYLNGQQQGFRIVYGYIINALDPLPPRDPTPEMINPITGANWTEQELQEYPHGYPGYPEHWPEGRISEAERIGLAPGVGVPEGAVGQSRLSIPFPDSRSSAYRGQDHSRTRLRDLRPTAAGAEFRWQFPETVAEVQYL